MAGAGGRARSRPGRAAGPARCAGGGARRGRGGGGAVSRRGDAERGSATVWAVLVACLLCAVFGGVLTLGQVLVARHRAAAAADLAALAAAGRWQDGEEAACAAAARVARGQSAGLVHCAVTGEIADVTARSSAGPFTPRIRARAGPPEAAVAPPPGPAPVPGPAAVPGSPPPSPAAVLASPLLGRPLHARPLLGRPLPGPAALPGSAPPGGVTPERVGAGRAVSGLRRGGG
ncbi:Rv3654c family TadE-like protein [Streptomyces sp. NBC_00239]|uniref:Rv3654c family TadE-like protein n=1 Tax=Streptomyces sp. NBC_00239 TaxID=2903640 RepID=UPI002E2E75A2|nr:Rv3654c family TadE-like protein [Streptomyces sp. NBC_00239]